MSRERPARTSGHPRRWNLRARLSVGVLALIVLSLLLTLASYRRVFRDRREAELGNSITVARTLANSVTAFTRDVEHTLLAVSLALEGQQEPLSQEQNGAYLREVFVRSGVLRAIFITDRNARVVASDSGGDFGHNLSSRPYMQALANGARSVWSDLLIGIQSGQVTVAHGRTIRAADGTVRGYLVAAFFPHRVLERIPITVPSDARVVVVDRRGSMLYTSDRGPATETMNFAREPEIQRALAGEPIVVRSGRGTHANDLRYGAVVPVAEVGWALSFTRPVVQLEAQLRGETARQAAGVTFLMVLGGILAGFVIHRLTSPLMTLASSADAIAEGERPTIPLLNDPPEVARLSAGMRAMSEAVADREDALREALRVREHVYRLAAKINRAANPTDIFTEALNALQMTVGVQRAAILLLDRRGVMRFEASRGLSDAYRAAVEGHSPWPADVMDPHPILVPDVGAAPDLASLRDLLAREGIRSVAFVPLVYNRRLIGKFMLYYDNIHAYTAAETQLVETIAGHVASGIGRDRAAEQIARAERSQRFLAEASSVLSTSLDYEATLRRVARLSVPVLADWCLIHIVEHGTVRRLEVAHTDPKVEERLKAFVAGSPLDTDNPRGPTMQAIKTQRTLLIPEITEEYLRGIIKQERVVRFALELGVRSVIGIPLIARGETLGAILLASIGNRAFDTEDVELAEELGRRAALAIDNARLFEQQRTVAETLQHSLLPSPLPEYPGMQLATRYVPGGRGLDVGGDWYDVFDLPTGLVGMVIGDVVGRGVEAAALMGQARNALRAYALDAPSPQLVVQRLNALMLRDTHAMMATVLYLIFDPRTRVLRFISAGHLPPLLMERDAPPRYVEGGRGLPLGVTPGAAYSESTISLSPGATVLLYTDGLVDRRTEPLDVAMDRLLAVAAQSHNDPTDVILDRILSSMLVDGHAEDDVAVLAFRPVHIGHDTLTLRLPARPETLARARHVLRQWFDEQHVPRDTASEIIVAVGEAASNVVTHAYGAREGDIVLELTADAGAVGVVVRDSGRWRSSPGGGGLGYDLMRAFMDSVEVEQHETGTVVRMRKRVGVLHVD